MNQTKLNLELDTLKRSEKIVDWSCCLGYGEAEYTLDLNRNNTLDLKALSKRLSTAYEAREFSRHEDKGLVSIKFVVEL